MVWCKSVHIIMGLSYVQWEELLLSIGRCVKTINDTIALHTLSSYTLSSYTLSRKNLTI